MEARTGGHAGAHICHCTNHRRGDRVMTTLLPPNVKVHLALGFIDMRKGIDGLAMLVQGVLQQDPFTGHLFVFRGRTPANLIKIIYRSEEHTSELQSHLNLVCRLLLEKKKTKSRRVGNTVRDGT